LLSPASGRWAGIGAYARACLSKEERA
jgi:hypothetical protein